MTRLREAATLKGKAKRLLRDIQYLLDERTLPASIRKEVEDVRAALKKTWADLELEAKSNDMEELDTKKLSIGGLGEFVRTAFREHIKLEYGWVDDVYMDHPQLGTCLICSNEGKTFCVPFTIDEAASTVNFAATEQWKPVYRTYAFVDETPAAEAAPAAEAEPEAVEAKEALVESFSGGVSLVEADKAEASTLTMDVQLIRPGFGNSAHNHYYPAEVLKRDAKVFEGAKMYESDHRPGEKSTRTWVSTVKEIVGFTSDGAPIGRVIVHDPNFAERVRNLNSAGLLDKMECSILAEGTAKKGKAENRDANIVESIVSAQSVDWVTRAGAGGKALNIAESEMPEPEAPVYLSEAEVLAELKRAALPELSKGRLAEVKYLTLEALKEAVSKEADYVKTLVGSGKPFALGTSQPTGAPSMSEAEYSLKVDSIIKKFTGR